MIDEHAAVLEQQQAELHGKHCAQPEQPQHAILQTFLMRPLGLMGVAGSSSTGAVAGGPPGWGPGLRPGEQLLRLQDETC